MSLEKLKNCPGEDQQAGDVALVSGMDEDEDGCEDDDEDQQTENVAIGSGGCGSGAVCSEGVKNQNTKKEQGQAVIDRIDLTQESPESEPNVQSIKPQEEEDVYTVRTFHK